MQQCFQEMGGVPGRIWFDNLSAAVVHIEKHGERQLTEGFQRFCAHYRIEAVFCNPYSGHEKGNVESKCGYAKRNWAVPLPQYETHEQLAAYFAGQARQGRERSHYAKGVRIAELWEADRAQLLALPEEAFKPFRLGAAVVNKYGKIRFEGATIPLAGLVPPGSELFIQTFWDRLVILTNEHQQVREVPRPYTGQTPKSPGSKSLPTCSESRAAWVTRSSYGCSRRRCRPMSVWRSLRYARRAAAGACTLVWRLLDRANCKRPASGVSRGHGHPAHSSARLNPSQT